MSTSLIKSEIITFENERQATVAFAPKTANPEQVVAALNLKPYNSVILILGGADSINEALKPRLRQLFDRGIARAAASVNAILVDGGTGSGVMKLMGEGVANRGNKSNLVGVATGSLVSYPGNETAGKISLDHNHSHFVLVEGNKWSSKTETMFDLVKAFSYAPVTGIGQQTNAGATTSTPLPTVAILAGGGETTRNEILYAVRHGVPMIVFTGSGGVADELSTAYNNREQIQADPVLAEIVEEGNLHFHALTDSITGIERLIIRELGIDNVLLQAWETFAVYDQNANRQQKNFDTLQLLIIILGLLGTTLAIVQQLNPVANGASSFGYTFLHHTLIIIPVLLTVLITVANKFKQGTKWLLLRAGAESIKREIYRYRAKAMYYSANPQQQLAKRIEEITVRIMRTEVNASSLKPYDKRNGFPPYMNAATGEDGFSSLTPDRYVEVRLADQLAFYQRKSVKLEKKLQLLSWLTFLIGGLGTYLAAIDQQIWLALTTSVVAAFGTYLGYRQVESTLTKYNRAATDLLNVKGWWTALSSEQQSQRVNIDSLVEHTEQVLQLEFGEWIQQMQNALAELRRGQEAPTEPNETREATGVTSTDIAGSAVEGNIPEQENGTDSTRQVDQDPNLAEVTDNGDGIISDEGNDGTLRKGTTIFAADLEELAQKEDQVLTR